MKKPFFYITDVIVFPIMLLSLGSALLFMSLYFHAARPDELLALHGTIVSREIRTTGTSTRKSDDIVFAVKEYNNDFQDNHISTELGMQVMEIDSPIIFSIRKVDSIKINSGSKIYTWSTKVKNKEYVSAKNVTGDNTIGLKVVLPVLGLILYATAFYTWRKKRKAWAKKGTD